MRYIDFEAVEYQVQQPCRWFGYFRKDSLANFVVLDVVIKFGHVDKSDISVIVPVFYPVIV